MRSLLDFYLTTCAQAKILYRIREAFESRQVSSARSIFHLSNSSLSLALRNLPSQSNKILISRDISSGVMADQIDTEVPIFSDRQYDLSSTKSGVCDSGFNSKAMRLLSSDSDSGFDKDIC